MYSFLGQQQQKASMAAGRVARLKTALVVIRFLKEVIDGPYTDRDIASMWGRSRSYDSIRFTAPGAGRKFLGRMLAAVEECYALDKAGKFREN
jgi:hypothetical protein